MDNSSDAHESWTDTFVQSNILKLVIGGAAPFRTVGDRLAVKTLGECP